MDGMATPKRRKPKGERKDEEIRIRVTAEEKAAFNAAAKKQGRELSNWLRFVANEAAGNGKSRGEG